MMAVELVQGDGEVGVVGFVDLVLFQKSSELKIWSAFILNLTASSANKIESLSWLADEHDVIWRQVKWL